MNSIFVDTWAWYALTDMSDTNHHLAQTTQQQLLTNRYQFVTTNFVMAETITLIRYKMYHTIAVRFWQMMQQLIAAELVELVRVSATQELMAWQIFERYKDQKFSFTDCTSFAVMQERRLTQVFTNDKHFSTLGFILLP